MAARHLELMLAGAVALESRDRRLGARICALRAARRVVRAAIVGDRIIYRPDTHARRVRSCGGRLLGRTTTAGNASGGEGASNASAGNGAGNGADGFNLFNATDFNSPLQAATLSANAAKLIALKGKGKVVSVPPAPPIPAGLPEGATCSSGFKGDAKLAQCLSFCIGKYARTHCQRCKCRACSFARATRRQRPPTPPHLAAEAARRRPRQQRPRRRPQRRPRRAAVGSGGRSGRDGGREHAGRRDCYCRRHCDCCEPCCRCRRDASSAGAFACRRRCRGSRAATKRKRRRGGREAGGGARACILWEWRKQQQQRKRDDDGDV